ncbi:uncharacterized protein LOC130668617 [Microplitis mediator]|uniref:uncharacterized protein LOC130668617 n=1 Tax=Microplitis mediator TaxID=375433 RepID=UPI002555B6A1|nr:uncharacterized protein LOC130668617 [Microplitis mediator]
MVAGDKTENEVPDVNGGGDGNSDLKNNNPVVEEDKDLNGDGCDLPIPEKTANVPTGMVDGDKTENEVIDVGGSSDRNSDLKTKKKMNKKGTHLLSQTKKQKSKNKEDWTCAICKKNKIMKTHGCKLHDM